MKTGAILLVLGSSAYAQYELSIARKALAEFGDIDKLPLHLLKRQLGTGTDSTNVYSILTYATGGAYYANVTIGTPPQNQVVILDTGSSDLYFDSSSAPSCQTTTEDNSCRGGSFDKSKSSTYQQVAASPAFDTAFGDGSTASGPFGADTLGIGSVNIANVQFGLAEKVNSTVGYAVGLMGLGYSLNEATEILYPNVPEVLKTAGVTSSRAYSVFLNDVGTGQGSILFGGVDTSKYTGTLQVLNLLPDPSAKAVYTFITTVTEVSTSVSGKSATIISGGTDDVTAFTSRNQALAVLLDTGSSAWSVPASIYSQIVKQFTYIDSYRLAPCSYRNSGDSVTLTFGAKLKIKVPITEFLVPLYNATTNKPYLYNTKGDYACRFMISPSRSTSAPYLTLGDAVLRSMYAVFDLDNGQVGLAQAAVNPSGSSNIVKLGPSGIAAAVSGAASAPRQTATIAPTVRNTRTFVASSAPTPIGTAVGINAIPFDARPAGTAIPGIYGGATQTGGGSGSGSGSGNGGSGSGSGSTPTPTGAASGLVAPAWTVGGTASVAWMTLMAVAGAAMLL